MTGLLGSNIAVNVHRVCSTDLTRNGPWARGRRKMAQIVKESFPIINWLESEEAFRVSAVQPRSEIRGKEHIGT